jgi:glutamate racemase
MDNRPIGIFDSGIGGLTVLDELKKQAPLESVIYFGDLARVPYGSKTKQEIIAINEDVIAYLVSRNVKMVIVACNTSSAIALEYDKDRFNIPIIGVIGPGANTAFAVTKNKKIGIIATEATVRAHAYKNILNSLNNTLHITERACPKFVPLIEAGRTKGSDVQQAIGEYLTPIMESGCDTLIFGCTHYPHIESEIRAFVGPEMKFVNPAIGTVALAREILERDQMLASGPTHYEYVASAQQGGKYVRIDGRELILRSTPALKK